MAEPTNPLPVDADVRMRGFSRRVTVEAALAWLDAQLSVLPSEQIALTAAARRVLAVDVHSTVDVPSFDRAMMDGYAVQAASVAGATSYNRLQLTIVGESFPGRGHAGVVSPGQAVRIMTGAPMPAGTDAVLPAELAEVEGDQLSALGEVSPRKHVGHRGEDVATGTVVLKAGRRLRPQDLGLLASIGMKSVAVVRRPQVNLIVTGSELVAAGSQPSGAKIADANGPMLAALVERDGGTLASSMLVVDDRDAIAEALAAEADVVIVSGGSSVGQEDFVPLLLAERGVLAVHGIAMRPSSPTGMGTLAGKLVFLLPGNPVSCLCAYDFFAGRAIRVLGGGSAEWPYRLIKAALKRKLTSPIGRLDYARVKLVGDEVEPLATSGASILSSTTRADGFVIVPADSEGYPAGAMMDVHLYD